MTPEIPPRRGARPRARFALALALGLSLLVSYGTAAAQGYVGTATITFSSCTDPLNNSQDTIPASALVAVSASGALSGFVTLMGSGFDGVVGLTGQVTNGTVSGTYFLDLVTIGISFGSAQAPFTGQVTDTAATLTLQGTVTFLQAIGGGSCALTVVLSGSPAPFSTLQASVLPGARSVPLDSEASAFATIINTGSTPAVACRILPFPVVPAVFRYQTTNAANQVTGTVDTPVDIPASGAQSFVFRFGPFATFAPTEIFLNFVCANTVMATIMPGVNTFLLSGSDTAVPDVIALASTMTGDGIVTLPGPTGQAAFAVATVNVGSGAAIVASADTGGAPVPVVLTICRTNPGTGACLELPGPSVSLTINAGETPTFAVFVRGTGSVTFDPAATRIFVRFKDGGGNTRGVTSVAVRTQ